MVSRRAPKTWGQGVVDAHNYLVTAPSIEGPGADPIHLNSSGFHPSLFHDRDGKKWLVNMLADHRPGSILEPRSAAPKGRTSVATAISDASPALRVPAPDLTPHPFEPEPARDDFDRTTLGVHLQTLRDRADPGWLSLGERPGHLRLYGRESVQSLHRQSLVGRRVQAFSCRFETCLEFRSESFQELAGLLCFYDDQTFYYAHLSHDETVGRCLCLLGSAHGKLESMLARALPFSAPRLFLRADFADVTLSFSFSSDGESWAELGPRLDATRLSDEGTSRELGFTGAFGALAAHDVSGARRFADFDYFEYREL